MGTRCAGDWIPIQIFVAPIICVIRVILKFHSTRQLATGGPRQPGRATHGPIPLPVLDPDGLVGRLRNDRADWKITQIAISSRENLSFCNPCERHQGMRQIF
jgi:hypothetical protein